MGITIMDVKLVQIATGYEVSSVVLREHYFTADLDKAVSYAKQLIDKTKREE